MGISAPKKTFCPHPKFPASQPPFPLLGDPSRETPWDFQLKNPPPSLAPWTPLPPPQAKKKKIRNVHQVNISMDFSDKTLLSKPNANGFLPGSYLKMPFSTRTSPENRNFPCIFHGTTSMTNSIPGKCQKQLDFIRKQTTIHDFNPPPEQTAAKSVFPQAMVFPAEKCIFLQKHALSCRKNALSCRQKCGFSVGTWQETTGNCRRASGLKNQER